MYVGDRGIRFRARTLYSQIIPQANLTEEEADTVRKNIQHNICELAIEHPNTTFYLFFPPHSILYYDTVIRRGDFSKMLACEEIVIEELLKYENIKLYSMANETSVICNLDNYIDQKHYSGSINSWILESMAQDHYLLTPDNYSQYLKIRSEYFSNYKYDAIYQ